jgi:hypothetical protein
VEDDLQNCGFLFQKPTPNNVLANCGAARGIHIFINMYIYKYICIHRERDLYAYIYMNIYIYICVLANCGATRGNEFVCTCICVLHEYLSSSILSVWITLH